MHARHQRSTEENTIPKNMCHDKYSVHEREADFGSG